MARKLGNFFTLIGILGLGVFFSSSAFLVDPAWFFLGGIGFTALGLLLKRRKKLRSARKNRQKIAPGRN